MISDLNKLLLHIAYMLNVHLKKIVSLTFIDKKKTLSRCKNTRMLQKWDKNKTFYVIYKKSIL